MEDSRSAVEGLEGESDDHSEASEEEEECRVCRGPAEEERPLYAPCKCSGSIGLTHQDCLTSWLAVTRGNGRCELCGMKFKFAPKYKEGAPDHLTLYEVCLGLCNKVAEKWLPMTLRTSTAVLLWLGVVPLATAYLYHGWLHRPSSILTRFQWQLVPVDLVSGAVIAAFIIVTFLSFMSFADFLRFNWNADGEGGFDRFEGDIRRNNQRGNNQRNAPRQPRRPLEGKDRGDWDLAVVQLEIINRMKEYVSRAAMDHQQGTSVDDANDRRHELQQMRELVMDMEKLIRPSHNEVPTTYARKQEIQRHVQTRELLDLLEEVEADNEETREKAHNYTLKNKDLRDSFVEVLQGQESAHESKSDDEDEFALEEDVDGDRDDAQAEDQPPLPDPLFDRDRLGGEVRLNADDDADMDINVALDELLGLRGPLNLLIRNVCWLLAFNTTFLGLFAFIPKNVGASMNSLLLNRTSFSSWMYNITVPDDDRELPFPRLISALNEESDRLNTTLRLPDLATITLGYLSLAIVVVLIQIGVFLHSKFLKIPPSDDQLNEMSGHRDRGQRDHAGEHAPRVDNVQARVQQGEEEGNDDILEGAGDLLTVSLNCIEALTKVGFLLFHKMLLLPLMLGVWLDGATLELFASSRVERAIYAGSDLFSSALLHWVAGITFMLFVTVSVLQLREVAHPGILGHVIRPQEPQPDLLSNLLHESMATHAKRMLLSFTIYAVLLSLYVWMPARILVETGVGKFMPFARPQFSHILMPQLQIPLELLVFHLTMLALLEKYKNRIGEMQHHWLVFMCDWMGLTEYVIPRTVDKFELIGSRCIFLRHLKSENDSDSDHESDDSEALAERRRKKALTVDVGRVDPFWYHLIENQDDLENFLLTNLEPLDEPPCVEVGLARPNGERVPRNMQEVLVLPPNWTRHQESVTSQEVSFLPTTIGPYRLCRRVPSGEKAMIVDFYKEIPGEPVPRPPEGWDDLGLGGAEVQGRWAWGVERKSTVERGVAARSRIFHRRKKWTSSLFLILKGAAVAVLSWVVISIIACLAVSFPVAAGRTVYRLLRVPEHYHHDPLAFAIGIFLWEPAFVLVSRLWRTSSLGRVVDWVCSFQCPPFRKGAVVFLALSLWLLVSPLAVGILYDLLLLKDRQFFSGENTNIDSGTLLRSWGTGTFLVNTWAFLCFCGVFSLRFWERVGNVAFGPEVERQGDENNQAHHNGVEQDDDQAGNLPRSILQAKMERFILTLMLALFYWEWDRVDHEALLQDIAFPLARRTVTSLVVPSAVFLAWLFLLSLVNQDASHVVVPLFGELDNALYRAIVFRTFAAIVLLAQFAANNQAALRRWFQAAHRAARDGRYLEGEILLNFVAE